jgi:hypothetical protein
MISTLALVALLPKPRAILARDREITFPESAGLSPETILGGLPK